jgi:hypothetical protein
MEDGSVLLHRRQDGSLNLLQLAGSPGTPAEEAAAVTTANPPDPTWTLNAPDIQVERLALEVNDEFVTPAGKLTFAPLNLTLKGFSTAAGQVLELAADVTVTTGGRLSLQGKGIPAEQTFQGTLKLDALDLAPLQPYVGSYTHMTLISGALDAALDVDYRPEDYRVAGTVSSGKLHTVDNALREDFIRWDRLTLSGLDYRSNPHTLRIASIAARSPYVRFIIAADQSTNVGKVLTMPASAPGPVQTVRGAAQPPTGATKPMTIAIGKVQVDNGSANFADFWIKPNYAVSLQQLAGSVSGLSSQKDSRATLALKGKIDRYAPVEIAGTLNLLSASLFTDIRVKFDGVELTSVTPYSGRFAGYRIEKGKLSVDVRYRVENRQLDAEQRFVVDQLSLGERVDSPDAVKLPLRLAVALLKDRNGVIDLALPVTGSLDDPKFRLGPIVWKAFVNLLAGVATSPFKLLGNVFGGGEDVNLIDFEPGSGTLDAAAVAKLASLTKAVQERPQLALEVPALYAVDRDFAVLAAQQLDEKLAAQTRVATGPGTSTGEARRFHGLLQLHRAEKPGAPLPPAAQALQAAHAKDRDVAAMAAANRELEAALRPGIDTLVARLEALAQLRARNIQDALLGSGQVEPGRVFMLAPGAAPAAGEKVRVVLSLK